MKKPLKKAPARLQRMLTKLQRYRFNLTYYRGPTLHLADTLSWAALPQSISARVTHFDVFRIEMESSELSRNARLEESTENYLRKETSKDITLTALYKVIVHGWPEDRSVISESLLPYWTYRDELSMENGIIYKGTQVVVPQAMHKEMFRKRQPFWCGIEHTYGPRSTVLARARGTPYKTCVMLVAPVPNTVQQHQMNR